MSPNELADRWSVSRPTVMRICKEAGIPWVFLSAAKGGTRRVRLADVVAHEEAVTDPPMSCAGVPSSSGKMSEIAR